MTHTQRSVWRPGLGEKFVSKQRPVAERLHAAATGPGDDSAQEVGRLVSPISSSQA